MKLRFLVPLALVLGAVGCDSQTPKQTEEQVKSFEGGPMPPEMREKLRQSQQSGGGAAGSTTTGG